MIGELPNMRKIEALTLEYRNVTLKVPIKKGGQKVVLDDVKGIAAAGTFTAIMGERAMWTLNKTGHNLYI